MFTTTAPRRGNPSFATTAKAGGGLPVVQLLIVIALLGIFAAVSFANASASARRGSLASSLRSIRGQVVVYALEHGDQLPDLAAASARGQHFQPFTGVTAYGCVSRGPYLPGVPVNPLTGASVVKDAATLGADGLPSPVPGADFIYDYGGGSGTGRVWATSDQATGTAVPESQ
jgi:type II secretory pathway pseudopilin PulG